MTFPQASKWKETYCMISKILKTFKGHGHLGTVTAHFIKLLSIFQNGQSIGQSIGSSC